MNKVTCYKLLYALGVTDTELSRDFRLEHRVASQGTFLMPGPSLLRFRANSAVFNYCVNNYYDIASVKQLEVCLQGLRTSVSCLRHFNREHLKKAETVIDVLGRAVRENSVLCRRAYQELECALSFSVFYAVVDLPEITAQTMARLAFIASKTERLYGLQFPGSPVLSVAIGAMFQSDLALRDRLSLLTGQRLDSIADRSQMGSAVDSLAQSAFVDTATLALHKEVWLYEGQPKNKVPWELVIEELKRDHPDIVLHRVREDSNLSAIPIVLTGDTRWVAEHSEFLPNVQFYVPLPIESKYYKQWKSRKVVNVFLVNRKPNQTE